MGLFKRDDSKVWWMSYSVAGRRVKESTGTKDKKAAAALLSQRQTNLFEGQHFPTKRKSGLTLGSLRDLFKDLKASKATL